MNRRMMFLAPLTVFAASSIIISCDSSNETDQSRRITQLLAPTQSSKSQEMLIRDKETTGQSTRHGSVLEQDNKEVNNENSRLLKTDTHLTRTFNNQEYATVNTAENALVTDPHGDAGTVIQTKLSEAVQQKRANTLSHTTTEREHSRHAKPRRSLKASSQATIANRQVANLRLERIELSEGSQNEATTRRTPLPSVGNSKTNATNYVHWQPTETKYERLESKRPVTESGHTTQPVTPSSLHKANTAKTQSVTHKAITEKQYHGVTDEVVRTGSSKKTVNYRLHLIKLISHKKSENYNRNNGDGLRSESYLKSRRYGIAYNWSFATATVMFIFIVTLPIGLYYFFASKRSRREYAYVLMDPSSYENSSKKSTPLHNQIKRNM